MEMLHNSMVLGVSRYSISGGPKGGKVYLLEQNSGLNPDLVGLELITANMPYEVFEQFNDKNLPAFYEVLISVERGAGGDDTEVFKAFRGTGDNSKARFVEFFKSLQSTAKPAEIKPEANVITGLVVSATRYDMEESGGNKGGSVYFVQPTSGRNPNLLGFEVLKARIPYDLFDLLQAKGLPGEYRLGVQIARRGGDKSRLIVRSIESNNTFTVPRLEQFFGLSSSLSPSMAAAMAPAASPVQK